MQVKALGRKFEHNKRCDFCSRIIPRGRVAYDISGDGVKAGGLYHGRQCYESALSKYNEEQGKLNIEDNDINWD